MPRALSSVLALLAFGCSSGAGSGDSEPAPPPTVTPAGGEVSFATENGWVRVHIAPGTLTEATSIVGGAEQRPVPRLPPADAPYRPGVRVELDSWAINPEAEGTAMKAEFSPEVVRGSEEITSSVASSAAAVQGRVYDERALVTIHLGEQEFSVRLPVITAGEQSEDGKALAGIIAKDARQGSKIVEIPAEFLCRARALAAIGREIIIEGKRYVVLEVLKNGRAVLQADGQYLDATVEFDPVMASASICFDAGGVQKTAELTDLPGKLSIDVLCDAFDPVYRWVMGRLADKIGPGKLFEVSFPDLSVAEVTRKEESKAERIVLVHGIGVFEPFLDLAASSVPDFVADLLGFGPEGVAQRVANKWEQLLRRIEAVLDTGKVKVYIFVYNTYLSIGENGKGLANELESWFDWSSGRDRIAIVGHSMGGLVSSAALMESRPPASRVQLLTLGTPFHGSPLANADFRRSWGLDGDGFNLQRLLDTISSDGITRKVFEKTGKAVPAEVIISKLLPAISFFLTRTEGVDSLDLDAVWSIVGDPALDEYIRTYAAEYVGSSCESTEWYWKAALWTTSRLLDLYVDPELSAGPFEGSDAVVPLFSAWRRKGSWKEAWKSIEEVGRGCFPRERHSSGVDHFCVKRADEVLHRVLDELSTFLGAPEPRPEVRVTDDHGLYGMHLDGPYVVFTSRDNARILGQDLLRGIPFEVAPAEAGVENWGCLVSADFGVVVWHKKLPWGRQILARRIVGPGVLGPLVELDRQEGFSFPIYVAAYRGPWLVITRGQEAGGLGSQYDLLGLRLGFDSSGDLEVVQRFEVDTSAGEQWTGVVSGNQLVYTSSPCQWEWQCERDWNLYLIDLIEKERRPLLADPEKNETQVAFDGKTLLYCEAAPYGVSRAELLAFDMEACESIRIATCPSSSAAGLSGDKVYYADLNADSSVFLYDLDTGLRELFSARAAQYVTVSGPFVVTGSGSDLNAVAVPLD